MSELRSIHVPGEEEWLANDEVLCARDMNSALEPGFLYLERVR